MWEEGICIYYTPRILNNFPVFFGKLLANIKLATQNQVAFFKREYRDTRVIIHIRDTTKIHQILKLTYTLSLQQCCRFLETRKWLFSRFKIEFWRQLKVCF